MGDLAAVLAERAFIVIDLYLSLVEIQAPERGFFARRRLFSGQFGRADGPGDVAEVRGDDLFRQDDLEGGHQALVFCRGSLKQDLLPCDRPVAHDLGQVVEANGVEDGRHRIVPGRALSKKLFHVPLHEDRAPLRGKGGRNSEDAFSDFVDPEPELVGLFLHEGAGPGRTDIVHVHMVNPPLAHVDVFCILPSDLEDRFDFVSEQKPCSASVRRDFVDDLVCADDLTDEVSGPSRWSRMP